MKRKAIHPSTTVFNFRLFLEGLKRLRVIGLASAILAITASALVPIVYWMEWESYTNPSFMEIPTEFLCAPAGFMVILAPFFFFVLFSFLQKRKESDFFHAIPYTRTCVYVSFVAAALVFVWSIQLACGLVAGLLWGISPALLTDLGAMTAYVGISMLGAAMLSAFMMLALTVSGTGSSCLLLFVLFVGFTRVVAAIFLGCLDSIYLLPVNGLWNHSVLSPLWFLPINVIYYLGDVESASLLMYSLPNILYSALVTVAVFALAGLIYRTRRSEMAGNPAPGVKTQALFRILFTTLPALLIPCLVMLDGGDASLTLVLVVGVLLVYFLYELITTKRPRNLLRIFPGLGVVAGICIAFTLLFHAYRGVVLYEDITKDEVKTVSVESNGFGYYTYQGQLLGTLDTDDSEMINLVLGQLSASQRLEREGSWATDENAYDSFWDRCNVTIRMKSGRTLKRSVMLGESVRNQINDRFMTLEEVSEIAYLLPKDREIRNGGVELGGDHYSEYYHIERLDEIMELFRREYASLTEAEKQEVMAMNRGRYDSTDGGVTEEPDTRIILTLRGSIEGSGLSYNSDYLITEALPETRAYLLGLWGVGQKQANYYDRGGQTYGGSADDVLIALSEDARDTEFAETFPRLKGNITLVGMGAEKDGVGLEHTFYLEAADYARFTELLLEASLIHSNTKVEDVAFTDHLYMLVLHTDMEGKYSSLHLRLDTLIDLKPEAYEELKALLQIDK